MTRTPTAFLVAPLVPPLVYWIVHSALSVAALPGIMLYGGTIAYLATAVAGVPAFLLIRSYTRLRFWHVIVIAALVGSATLLLMSHPPAEAGTAVAGALYGLSAGLAFWLVWWRVLPNQPLQQTGLRPAAERQYRWTDKSRSP